MECDLLGASATDGIHIIWNQPAEGNGPGHQGCVNKRPCNRKLPEPEFSPDDSDHPFTPYEQSEVAEHLSAIEHRLGLDGNTPALVLVCSDTAQSYVVIFRMIPNPSPYNICATGVAIKGLAFLGALSPKRPQPYPG